MRPLQCHSLPVYSQGAAPGSDVGLVTLPQVAPNLMQQLGAVLATEGGPGLPGSEIDAILKNLKGLQEQVALLDRMQNIRWVLGWG